jgi:hypothetical protein
MLFLSFNWYSQNVVEYWAATTVKVSQLFRTLPLSLVSSTFSFTLSSFLWPAWRFEFRFSLPTSGQVYEGRKDIPMQHFRLDSRLTSIDHLPRWCSMRYSEAPVSAGCGNWRHQQMCVKCILPYSIGHSLSLDECRRDD